MSDVTYEIKNSAKVHTGGQSFLYKLVHCEKRGYGFVVESKDKLSFIPYVVKTTS